MILQKNVLRDNKNERKDRLPSSKNSVYKDDTGLERRVVYEPGSVGRSVNDRNVTVADEFEHDIGNLRIELTALVFFKFPNDDIL